MRRDFHLHPIARSNPNKIHFRHTRRVRQNQILILQLHSYHGIRQKLDDLAFDRHLTHGRVKTHGPLSVTATQCSKCAE